MKKQNKLRTEAAQRRALKMLGERPYLATDRLHWGAHYDDDTGDFIVYIYDNDGECIAEWSLKDSIKKRQPLTGIGKRVAALTRTKAKKKGKK